MGLFDDVTFEEGFDKLPEGLKRSGWQTKDLGAAMCHFYVKPDGLVVRKRGTFGAGAVYMEINPQLNTMAEIYDSDHSLLIVVEKGYVVEVAKDWKEEPSIDEGWIIWKG